MTLDDENGHAASLARAPRILHLRDGGTSVVADLAAPGGPAIVHWGEALADGVALEGLLIQLRLSHAQALLAETDLTVAAIARQVGYDDAGYFSRLFSRRIGESPSAFRRGQQSGPPRPHGVRAHQRLPPHDRA